MAQALTTIGATIARVSEHGFQIREQPGKWFNVSKFVEPAPIIPAAGTEVEISINAKGYVVEINRTDIPQEIADASPDAPGRAVRGVFLESDSLTVRINCLQAAAAFLANRPDAKSGDVVRVAENWEAWLIR